MSAHSSEFKGAAVPNRWEWKEKQIFFPPFQQGTHSISKTIFKALEMQLW